VRKLIAAFRVSVDSKIEGPDGYAGWVGSWSDDYGLTSSIDACVLGGEMYKGYEPYWTGVRNEPSKAAWITGEAPTQGEIEWAAFAARTPHYVVSRTQRTAAWPNTRFLRSIDEIAGLKAQDGKDIYLMGGARLAGSCLDRGLVDELRLLVYPLVAGPGKPLFETIGSHALILRNADQLNGGLVRMHFDVKH